MAGRGHQTTLLAPAEARIHSEAPKFGVRAVALPIGRKTPRAVFALRRWLAAERPDVVNTHSSTDAWLTALSGWRRTVRTRHISAPVGANALNRWLYGEASRRVVTTGERLREDLLERLSLPPGHVLSVPTGIDLALYRRTGQGRGALGIPQGGFVFGIVATLRSWKGHAFLIDAFDAIATEEPRLHLVIAGEGPQRPALEPRIAACTARERIHLLGHREDVPLVLDALDCFVLPSYANEGVPQALMQAMATGLPVITTRVGSIEEVVTEGETGVFVPPKDVRALGGAMLDLSRNPDLRRRLGDSARRASERFSIERMLDGMEAVFRQAAA